MRTEEEAFLLCHSEAKEKAILLLKEQAQAKEDSVGTYVLRTNRLDLSGKEISKLHI